LLLIAITSVSYLLLLTIDTNVGCCYWCLSLLLLFIQNKENQNNNIALLIVLLCAAQQCKGEHSTTKGTWTHHGKAQRTNKQPKQHQDHEGGEEGEGVAHLKVDEKKRCS
jgi:hypothetical protein